MSLPFADDSADETDTVSDAALVESARTDDGAAFGELWTRHAPAALMAARQFASTADPDDLVAEAYTRILAAVRAGKGPTGAFRPYLFVTIRHLAGRIAQSSKEEAVEDIGDFEDHSASADPAIAALDRTLTARAFRSLPERWQTVLWYTAVEGMTPREAAPMLGLSANSTAALALRARAGLREAWIQAHVNDDSASEDCRWALARMGKYVRGELSVRERERAELHIAGCQKCLIVSEEIDDVSGRLAIVVLPLALGGAAGMGYLAMLHGGAAVAGATTAAGVHAVGAHGGGATLAGGQGSSAASGGAGAGGGAAAGATTAAASTGWLVAAGIAAVVVIGGGAAWGAIALNSHPSSNVSAADTATDPRTPPAAPRSTPTPSISPTDTPIPPATPPHDTKPPVTKLPVVSLPPVTDPPDTNPPVTDQPPAVLPPVITTSPDQSSSSRPQVAGRAEPGATIRITDQAGATVATIVADGAGNWSTGPLTSLPVTTTSLRVVQTDVDGNVSAPVMLGPYGFHPTMTVSGPIVAEQSFDVDISGWANTPIAIDIKNNTAPYLDTLDPSGHLTVPGALPAGHYTLELRYSAPGASTAVVTLDITVQ